MLIAHHSDYIGADTIILWTRMRRGGKIMQYRC